MDRPGNARQPCRAVKTIPMEWEAGRNLPAPDDLRAYGRGSSGPGAAPGFWGPCSGGSDSLTCEPSVSSNERQQRQRPWPAPQAGRRRAPRPAPWRPPQGANPATGRKSRGGVDLASVRPVLPVSRAHQPRPYPLIGPWPIGPVPSPKGIFASPMSNALVPCFFCRLQQAKDPFAL